MNFDINLAEKYLMRQYNPASMLMREAPNAAPTTYWVYNDAVVASYAMEIPPNMYQTIEEYRKSGWIPPVNRIDVLSGGGVDPQIPLKTKTIADIGSHKILTEDLAADVSQYIPLNEYVDVDLYYCLNELNNNNYYRAVDQFVGVLTKFDGYGFRDRAYKGIYATYKVALALIVLDRLGLNSPSYVYKFTNILNKAQCTNTISNQYGGCFTDYLTGLKFTGDTNVETTALCLMAMRNRV